MHENSSTMRERLEYIYLYTFFAHVFYPLTICNTVWNREFVTVFVLFLICTFDTYKHTNTHFFLAFSPKQACVRACVFFFISTSFGFIRCYVDIHLALLYCSVTVNVKMPFRKFDILYLDIRIENPQHA